MPVTRRPAGKSKDDLDYEDEPEETPRRRRAAPAAEEPAPRRSRPERDDEDDPKPSKIKGGWGGFKKVKEAAPSTFAKEFKFPSQADGEKPVLIKFLEDEPFSNYLLHWQDEIRSGKRSFICMATDDCPLCELGNDPSARTAFNIVVIDPSEEEPVPRLEIYSTGIKGGLELKAFHEDDVFGPLTKGYFSAIKTGKGQGKTQMKLTPVKERDVEEDYDVEPLTKAEIEKFREKMMDDSKFPNRESYAQLAAVADAIS